LFQSSLENAINDEVKLLITLRSCFTDYSFLVDVNEREHRNELARHIRRASAMHGINYADPVQWGRFLYFEDLNQLRPQDPRSTQQSTSNVSNAEAGAQNLAPQAAVAPTVCDDASDYSASKFNVQIITLSQDLDHLKFRAFSPLQPCEQLL